MVVLILDGLELVSWFDLGDSVRCEHNLLNRGHCVFIGNILGMKGDVQGESGVAVEEAE